MDLQNLREKLTHAIEASGKSQAAFAAEHGFSSSTLNKFLKGHLDNPRFSTLTDYERAIRRARGHA